MKLLYCVGCVSLLIAAAPVAAQVQVETFNATATYQITLPGAIVGPNIDFSGMLVVTSLDFTPGAVTFNGQPVDFDGTEASWLANAYNGVITIPLNPGGTVNGAGAASTAGPAGNMNGDMGRTGLDLGPGFSDSNFDLRVPSMFDGNDQAPKWNSPVVPELNGSPVTVVTVCDVVNVIPNFMIGAGVALVEVVITGEIVAFESIPTELTTWGRIKAFYE